MMLFFMIHLSIFVAVIVVVFSLFGASKYLIGHSRDLRRFTKALQLFKASSFRYEVGKLISKLPYRKMHWAKPPDNFVQACLIQCLVVRLSVFFEISIVVTTNNMIKKTSLKTPSRD